MLLRSGSRVPRQAPPQARMWAVSCLLFAIVLSAYLLSFNVDQPTHNGDWFIRYQVTCSIVERNQFYVHRFSPDARVGPGVGGHDYSQYTLGQTTAMIPLYLLGRALAGVAHTNCDATSAQPIVFLTCKTLDLILGALLCVLFFHAARLLRYTPAQALSLAALLAFGTALWPDAQSNLEHTMESLLLLVAVYAALRYTLQRHKSRLWVAVMGVAAGLDFVTRLAGIIVVPILVVYLVVLHRRQNPDAWRRTLPVDLLLFGLCAAPSFIVNAAFDALRFGSPLRPEPYPDQTFGFPPWLGIPDLLVSPGKGLIWYTPAVLLLVLVARPFWRRFPLPAILSAIVAGVYVLFYANVNYWHGDPAWGPRYLYPILPYLILPLGEVLRRWRAYRRSVRAAVTVVLASSVLVQLVAVSISYWRYWHWIFGYHFGEITRFSWGFNFNNWWSPAQSPIVQALLGIGDVVRAYVDRAPLLQHPMAERLGNPNDTCIYHVTGRASVCLTDVDRLRYVDTSNTFTMWWVHTFPWWSASTVTDSALTLAAILVAGAALAALLAWSAPAPAEQPLVSRQAMIEPITSGLRQSPALWSPHGAAVAERRARATAAAPAVAGLAQIAVPAFAALAIYGGIAGAAALTAPRHAAALPRTVPGGSVVQDGTWTYRVVGVGAAPSEPNTPRAADYRLVAVRLRLINLSARANRLQPTFFSLLDAGGMVYPWAPFMDQEAARVYHLHAFSSVVPAHAGTDRVLLALVPKGQRELELLGPGLALVRLDVDPARRTPV